VLTPLFRTSNPLDLVQLRRLSSILDLISPLNSEGPDQSSLELSRQSAVLLAMRSHITREDMHEWWTQYASSETHRDFLRAVYRFCAIATADHKGSHWEKVRAWTWDVIWLSALDWIWVK
jgi:hypothetical protein